jgi:hypothetical protein
MRLSGTASWSLLRGCSKTAHTKQIAYTMFIKRSLILNFISRTMRGMNRQAEPREVGGKHNGCKGITGGMFMSGKGSEGAASTMLDGNTNPPYDE